MPDETATSDNGGASPAAEAPVSSTGTDAAALGGATNGEATSQTAPSNAAQGAEAPTAELTDDVKYAIPENADIRTLREKYDLLNTDFRTTKETAKQYEPWKDFTAKYRTPDQVQPLVEISQALFTPVMENGQQVYRDGVPATTTAPAIQMLHDRDPQTFIQLSEEMANFSFNGRPVIDWQLMSLGLNPANIDKYREFEKNGGQNVAHQGDAATVDEIDQIPEQFREVFKSMPPATRSDILLMEAANQEYFLQAAQDRLDNQKFRAEQTKQQTQRHEQHIAQQKKELETAQVQAVERVTDSTFEALLNDIVADSWKPSADEQINAGNHALIMGAMCALADPDWSKRLNPLLEKAGIKVDVPGFKSLMNQVSEAAKNIEAHKRSGNQMQMNHWQAELDRATYSLKAKGNGMRAELTSLLSGTRAEIRQAQESRINATGARPVINGNATNGNGGFQLPPGVKEFSPEANRYVAEFLQSHARQ